MNNLATLYIVNELISQYKNELKRLKGKRTALWNNGIYHTIDTYTYKKEMEEIQEQIQHVEKILSELRKINKNSENNIIQEW